MENKSIKEDILQIYLNIRASRNSQSSSAESAKHELGEDSPFSEFLDFIKQYLKNAGLGDIDPLDFLLSNTERFASFLAMFLNQLKEDEYDDAEDLIDKNSVPDALRIACDNANDPDSFEFWQRETSQFYLKSFCNHNSLEEKSSYKEKHETSTPFDCYSKDELISFFNAKTLSTLTQSEIAELCQSLSSAYAKEHNTAPALVQVAHYKDPAGKITYGTYYAGSNKIGINETLLKNLANGGNDYEAMKLLQAVLHESHHGVQFNNIGKMLASDSKETVVADLLALTENENQSNKTYQEYLWQVEEIDARFSALKEINIARKKGLLSDNCSEIVDRLNKDEKAKNIGSARGVLDNINKLSAKCQSAPSMQNILRLRKLNEYTDPSSEKRKTLEKLLKSYEEMPFTESPSEA